MMDRESACIEPACTRIVHAYAKLADFGDVGGAAALFAESGRPEMPNGQVFEDRFVLTPDGRKFATRKLTSAFRS